MHVNFNEDGEIHRVHRAGIVIDSKTTVLSMPRVKKSLFITYYGIF